MRAEVHGVRGALLLLVAATSACGWGHPQPPPPGPTPAPPAAVHHFPDALERRADLFGPPPEAFTSSTSDADVERYLDVLGDERDAVAGDATVEPILAVTGTTVTFDIPMIDHERVDYWVQMLSEGRGRGYFERWLARTTRYVPLLWEILEQYDLPKDLVFLAMVESGFSPRAYSWAHAAGPWQFMPYTGRRYGLEIGFWLDERRDFEKATHAAARYLSVLREMFGEWTLAMAAYNAGPGKVGRAVRGTGIRDFWRLAETRRLRRETKHYIPKILAAARIAKQPAAYGFEGVVYQPRLDWETVTVTVATDLGTLARACEVEALSVLEDLNPELRAKVTPPGRTYAVRVPLGKAATCGGGLARLNPALRMTYRYARVQKSDTLEALAARHRTTPAEILRFNRIEPEQLPGIDELVIPVPLFAAEAVPIVEPDTKRFRHGVYEPGGQQLVVHRVRTGDSLWRIARRYGVSVRKLRLWNGLWRTNTLQLGQRVKVFLGPGEAARVLSERTPRQKRKSHSIHVVRPGESLWTIARDYNVSVGSLRRVNELEDGGVLQVGQRLRIE